MKRSERDGTQTGRAVACLALAWLALMPGRAQAEDPGLLYFETELQDAAGRPLQGEVSLTVRL